MTDSDRSTPADENENENENIAPETSGTVAPEDKATRGDVSATKQSSPEPQDRVSVDEEDAPTTVDTSPPLVDTDGGDANTDGADTDGADADTDGADVNDTETSKHTTKGEVSTLARLTRLTQDSFSGVEALELFDNSGGYLAAILVSDKVDEKARLDLGRQVVELFAGQGVRVEPLLYRGPEWKALSQRGGSRWPALLLTERRAKELRQLYLQNRPYPRDFRRMLLSSARAYLSFVELILREAPFPLHLTTSLMASTMRDALELLFASQGQRFDDTAATHRLFEELFVSQDNFGPDHLSLYFQLQGLAKQTQHFHDLGAPLPSTRFDWEPLAERTRTFFETFERYVQNHFSTAQERRKRRLLRIGLPSATILVLTVAIAWAYFALKPIEPVDSRRNAELRRHQGGLTATYYKGNNFQKKVRERIDSTININTTGTPEPKAGADNFSVRWTGYLRFLRPERHVICADSDNGMRVWFAGEKIIDDWKSHRLHQKCAKVRVKKGWYPLKVEYHEDTGLAVARIKVGLDERHKKLIHPNDLCCRPPTPPKRPPLKRVNPHLQRAKIATPVVISPKGAMRKPGAKKTSPQTAAKKPAAKKPAAKKPAAKKPAAKKPAAKKP